MLGPINKQVNQSVQLVTERKLSIKPIAAYSQWTGRDKSECVSGVY